MIFQLWDNAGKPKLLPGKILISVGGSQPDETTIKNKKTVQAYL